MNDKAADTTPAGTAGTSTSQNRGHAQYSDAFRTFIAQEWAPRPDIADSAREVASFTPARRSAVSEEFSGDRLVFPAGTYKQRSNDTDYRFRPHTAFAHLTGLCRDEEPDAVFVMEPRDGGHTPILFFRPMAGRDVEEFYANATYGELWVGVRPTLDDLAVQLGIECRHIDEFAEAISKNDGDVTVRIIREADPKVTALVDNARTEQGVAAKDAHEADGLLAQFVSELRLVKDSYEINQMRLAFEATHKGFDEIVRTMDKAVNHHRGERVVESAFFSTARAEGNGVGYDIIAASGNNACTLHWVRNDGRVKNGDLILIDAGVEMDSLYTADITRTLPVNGTFTEIQRRIYDAVLAAADAAFAVAKPGVTFKTLHQEAIKVIAEHVVEWGLLDCTVEETLDPKTGGFHRRWMVHGTSHHLGMDVHDCASARKAQYADAELREGMIFTIEPGLYFKEDDLSVPVEYRGIGVRIEDNVLITANGCESLSAAMPRRADEIEAWMRTTGMKANGSATTGESQ